MWMLHGESGCMSHDNSGQHTTYPSGHSAQTQRQGAQFGTHAAQISHFNCFVRA